MLEALSTPRNRTLAFVFLVICCASATAAAVVGISDNPPGILLAFGEAAALVLALVHPWRNARQFRFLLYASVLGFVIFGILHNVFEALAGKTAGAGALHGLLQGLGAAAFLLAALICPAAILVGAVGWIVMLIRKRRRPTQRQETDA